MSGLGLGTYRALAVVVSDDIGVQRVKLPAYDAFIILHTKDHVTEMRCTEGSTSAVPRLRASMVESPFSNTLRPAPYFR